MRKKQVITEPLDDKQKAEIFAAEKGAQSPEAYLEAYILRFMAHNKIPETYEMPRMRLVRLVGTALFCLALLAVIAHLFFYHVYYYADLAAALVSLAVYAAVMRRACSMQRYLTREILRQPDADIDVLLFDTLSSAKKRRRTSALCVLMLVCAFAAGAAFFSVPHAIYRPNNAGGCTLAFYSTSLFSEESVSVPDVYGDPPVNELRGGVFAGLPINAVRLPAGLTAIPERAFYDCDRLREIDLPQGTVNIGDEAFSGCESLTRVGAPGSVRFVGSKAFAGCVSLAQIELPAEANVNASAFENSAVQTGQ